MKIIAHRGASGTHVENTLPAFKQAIIDGADAIELDVQYHHSGALIVSHDTYLLFKSDVKHINDLTLDELLSIEFADGSSLTTLEKALSVIKGQCDVNIEVKSAPLFSVEAPDGLIDEVLTRIEQVICDAIEQHSFQWQQFTLSSFNHTLIATSLQRMPALKLGALSASSPRSYAKFAQDLSAYSINLAIDCINPAMIDDAHRRGLKVWVYTVNNTQDIKWCHALGVDGIFTDFPKQSRAFLDKLR